MEALIIAAGKGSRISHLCSPKPLTPIFGLSLIERIILAAKRVGILDFKIVVGYQSSKLKNFIGKGDKYGVQIEYIENTEWEKGNGISVLMARNYMHGKFLLLMSDHLFDEIVLNKLLSTSLEDGHCILCIDKNLSGDHFSLEDVTKVQSEGDKVKHIGKKLEDYNSIDTGIFFCTPVIFDAVERSVKMGKYSLSSGNQILADEGKLSAIDITGGFWIDVDDEQALKKARRMLISQMYKPTDGPVSTKLNRQLSIRITSFLARYNVSPNSITLASFCFALLSAFFFLLGGRAEVLVAGCMAQLSSIVDGCDGEIARLKFRFSSFGEWLDKVLDRYADGLIVLGMTYGLWKSTAKEYYWIAGFFALTGTFMNSYTATIYDELIRKKMLENASIRIGRDVRLFIVFIGGLLNQIFIALLILAIVTNIESIRRLFVIKGVYKVKVSN